MNIYDQLQAVEDRYEELKNCLLTLERYECNRLRYKTAGCGRKPQSQSVPVPYES